MYKLYDFFNIIYEHLFKVFNRHRPINLFATHTSISRHCRTCSGNLDQRVKPVDDYKSVVQCGRSMIEMLGVLAIISVLSIGGIAGYSKAMTKYKINKAIDEVNTIVANTKIIFANSKKYSYDNFYDVNHEKDFEFVRDYIMPKETYTGVKDDNNLMFQHPLGGSLEVSGYNAGITITLYDLPREACITLGSYEWKDSIAVYVSKDELAHSLIGECNSTGLSYGMTDYNEDGLVSRCLIFGSTLPIPPDLVAKGCSCTSNTCQLSVAFP